MLWAIAAASFVAIFALNRPFPLIVLGAAAIGHVGGWVSPQWFKVGGGHGGADKSYGAALIDDHTPTPDHARFRWLGLAKIALVGGLLWLVPMAWLTLPMAGRTL